MDIILMFQKAAVELQQDERYLRLQKARQENDQDELLQNAINEFDFVRSELNREIEKQERDEARLGELNQKLNATYTAIMENPNMLAYNEAKADIKPLVEHINAIISAAIDGGDPMQVEPPSSNCQSGCAGCQGCG